MLNRLGEAHWERNVTSVYGKGTGKPDPNLPPIVVYHSHQFCSEGKNGLQAFIGLSPLGAFLLMINLTEVNCDGANLQFIGEHSLFGPS